MAMRRAFLGHENGRSIAIVGGNAYACKFDGVAASGEHRDMEGLVRHAEVTQRSYEIYSDRAGIKGKAVIFDNTPPLFEQGSPSDRAHMLHAQMGQVGLGSKT
ncbi:hypothetical protein Scep_014934 [Stephania cephalantha]|uniref:Uncharacterized protein n=1 Tax=Stephania cephalantha TaxID=152367 RepID=A0AAP0J299_9MAGN